MATICIGLIALEGTEGTVGHMIKAPLDPIIFTAHNGDISKLENRQVMMFYWNQIPLWIMLLPSGNALRLFRDKMLVNHPCGWQAYNNW